MALFFPTTNLLHLLVWEFSILDKILQEGGTYSSEREYSVFRWALRSITMAMMTEVRIKGILVSSSVWGLLIWSALFCEFDFVGLRNWASRCEGEMCSRTCMPAVDRIAVRCLITVRTSSTVLYSSAAKFSAMYRVKSTSSCRDSSFVKRTSQKWNALVRTDSKNFHWRPWRVIWGNLVLSAASHERGNTIAVVMRQVKVAGGNLGDVRKCSTCWGRTYLVRHQCISSFDNRMTFLHWWYNVH